MLAAASAVACGDESVVVPPAGVVSASQSRTSPSATQTSDREILIAFYNATDGPNWINSDNWLTDAPLGEWYGVDTDASGRVVQLDLYENELSGTIPMELGRLAKLERLFLTSNTLSGAIPPELGRVTNLEMLDLSWNELSGPIPPELGNLPSLWRLALYENDLSGPIPSELGGLTSLRQLWLRDNDLAGPIPVELGDLANLQSLHLGANDLSAAIPAELGGLANLQSLHLGGNELSDAIPAELGGLASLQWLDLGGNELSDAIPAELGGLASLQWLSLGWNELSGTIPLNFQQLSELWRFGFEQNAGLCLPDALVAWYQALEVGNGPVCPDRKVLRALYEAAGGRGWTNADGWLGDGPLGEWYGVEVDSSGLVSTVDLAGNGLSGRLPGTLGNLAGLTVLRIGDNALSGRVPTSLGLTPLQELRYANTNLCAPVEAWFQEWLTALAQYEGTGVECPPLSDREILTALYETTDGPNWKESRNWLTDAPLEEWHGVETDADGAVVSLDLRLNGLDGPIPPDLGGLAELDTLIFFINRLTGPIPSALGGLAKAKLVVLAGNRLSGPIPPELGGLAGLEELFLNGNRLTFVPPELGKLGNLQALALSSNQLTSVPPELGGLAQLEDLSLARNELTSVPPELGKLGDLQRLVLSFNRLTSVPPELGNLAKLQFLFLWSNELTSIPPALGKLDNLLRLSLGENRLTSIPAELGGLGRLEVFWLTSNSLASFPWELSELESLRLLDLERNRLTAVPPGPGGFPSLLILDLSSNELTSFPRELGMLGSLRQLELDRNQLTDIPPGLGRIAGAARLPTNADELPSVPRRLSNPDHPWRLDPTGNQVTSTSRESRTLGTLRTHMESGLNRSTNVRSRVGAFASLEVLDLSSNELAGSLPAGLVEFTGVTSLSLAGNVGLTGALPLDLTALEGLEDLHTIGTELCAPADPSFRDWLDGVTRQRVALCDHHGNAAAYLTQAVQSREFPVPLVAGKPALLRVFVTARQATSVALPPVRATFYRDGALTYELDIPSKQDPIPVAIDESSLSKSVNAEVPGWVIQPGLEVAIEPDPAGTLDPELGVAKRIPATGRMSVDVRAMPVFEVTLVPFIWDENPDSSIVDITAAMAADPEGHELFERTHLLLPVAELDVTAHPPVASPTNNGFEILALTEMIRVAEGGRGHYLGVMAGPTGPGGLLGVANDIGSWSSFSVLDSETIAHEFGHNRNLYHAPACGAGGPDRYYPYGRGNIGAWGWDARTGELVPPGRWDYMSYCEPTWTSDYQFTNAVRYRLETESNSIIVATADNRAAASSSRTLLVWGGLDGDGVPYVKPAFFIDAPTYRPSADGAWSLTGRDPTGAELFSASFDMAEFTDTEDDHAGFSFALPMTWTGELASMTLEGPGGSASLDRDVENPLTILRDSVTGQVRGILEGPLPGVPAEGPTATAARQGLEILFSRGIPGAGNDPR